MLLCPRCQRRYQEGAARCPLDGEALQPLPDERIGERLKEYVVESRLRGGGMALVYRGRHVLTNRPVAIKIMHKSYAGSAQLRERFRREARNAAMLAHPLIVEIYDYGETADNCPFLVMELLDGQPMDVVLTKGPLPISDCIRFGRQIAEALARAHDFGVVHRDLKTGNIFIVNSPNNTRNIKLLDFGIARAVQDEKLTQMGEIMGTPQYMAPEAVVQREAHPSMDMYALGCVLFKMITARTVFTAPDPMTQMMAHLNEQPVAPSTLTKECPPALDDLVLSLLRKDPRERPVDAHQVVRTLKTMTSKPSIFPGQVVAATPQAPAPQAAPGVIARWQWMAEQLDSVLTRAYGPTLPAAVISTRQRFQQALDALASVYGQAMELQKLIDAADNETKDGRTRLGRAVQSLGEDLSRAREELRQLDGANPATAAREEYIATLRTITEATNATAGVPDVPRAAISTALRAAADAMDRWVKVYTETQGSSKKRADAEVRASDLEFQVNMLRGQLEKLEKDRDAKVAEHSAALQQTVARKAEIEPQLAMVVQTVVNAVSARPDLVETAQNMARTLQQWQAQSNNDPWA